MRRAITLLSLLAFLFQVPVVTAGTPTTWGRVKRLYGSGERVVPGPGVTSAEAERAVRTIRRESFLGIEGAVRAIRGEPGAEGALIVFGDTGDERDGVHLVGAVGNYLGGAIVDQDTGTVLDARTGGILFRATTGDLRRELRQFETQGLQEALASICKGLAFSIFAKCAASMIGNPVGELGCLALLLVMVLFCQGDLHFKRAHDGDCQSSAMQAGASLGSFCN